MTDPGLAEAIKIVRSPQFNTNPTQRLVDETLVRVIYPAIRAACEKAYAPPAPPADAPRMIGNANDEVVEYWKRRAEQAEAREKLLTELARNIVSAWHQHPTSSWSRNAIDALKRHACG